MRKVHPFFKVDLNSMFKQRVLIFCLAIAISIIDWAGAGAFSISGLNSIASAQQNALKNSKKALKKSKKALKKSKKAKKGVKQLSEELGILGSQVEVIEAENSTQQGQIESNTSTNAAQDTQISTNTATNATQDADIANNTATNATQDADIATNAADISANTATNNAQDADIANNTATNNAQDADIANNTATNNAQDADIANNTATNATQDADIATNAADISANTTTNATQDTDISTNAAAIAAQDTAITTIQSAVSNLSLGIDDDSDGVEITFIREFGFDSGNGIISALDLNGMNLVINQADPTVHLGGQILNVLTTGDIAGTNPILQQVVVDLPSPLFAGQHKLKLENAQGKSNVFIHITGTVDTSLPVITLNGSNSVNVAVGTTYVDEGATAIDAEDGNITANITATGFPIDTSTVGGSFIITYNVSDSSGNAAAPVTRAVTVIATYAWQTSAFGSCSATCGGGTQTRSVSCQRNDGVTVIDSFCSGAKPTTTQSCNTHTCYTGSWNLSSLTCSTSTLNAVYECTGGPCDPATKPAGTIANGCREATKDFPPPDGRAHCTGPNWTFMGSNTCNAIIGGHSMYSLEGTRTCGCSNFGIVWEDGVYTSTGNGQASNCQCFYYCPKRNCPAGWVPK